MFAFEFNYNRFTGGFYWRSVSLLVLMTLSLLIAACRIIRTSWQSLEPSGSAEGKLVRSVRRLAPRKARLAVSEFASRGADLYAWLSSRGSGLGASPPWFLSALTAFWFLMLAVSGIGRTQGGQQAFVITMLTAFAMHAITKGIFALEATRQIHQDVRSGNMQLLLATPLHEREIALGQVQACRKGFRGPLILLTSVNVLMEISIFVFYDRLQMRSVAIPFSVFFLGGILALHLDSRAIQWVGVWKSLQAPTHLKATFATLKSVLGIPWILFPMLFAIAVNRRGGQVEEAMAGWMSCWFLLGTWLDLILIGRAKRHLRTRFRELVALRGT